MKNNGDTSDDDLSGDALVEVYKIIYLRWKDGCKVGEN